MYKFKIPIGDWSNDGHGEHVDYLIESNKPVEKVRQLYFQACDKIGFSLDNSYKQTHLTPAVEYENANFSEETLKALLDFGVEIEQDVIDGIAEEDYVLFDTEILCDIVLNFIKTQDPNLQLKRVESEDFPMLQSYGFQNGKHMGYFGYGLFN
jgi:hypothetical protein